MFEDAITDELADLNPVRGVKVRANDTRARKTPKPVRVLPFEDMRAFATAAGVARTILERERLGRRGRGRGPVTIGQPPAFEAIVRTFADTGMRLGEVLPLRRTDLRQEGDGHVFYVIRTSHEGREQEGTKTDHGEQSAGRIVPCPPGLLELLRALPPRIDTDLLFPTPTGRLWRERNFYRDVWQPARDHLGVDWRPHEFRHSYVTHLRAAGIDDADLADVAGHRVETTIARYTHALRRSHDRIRGVIG